jgi:hypothetical protein
MSGTPMILTQAARGFWSRPVGCHLAQCRNPQGRVLTAVVRGLSGDQLARSGTVFVGLPPMSAGQLLICGFVNYIDEHFGGASIGG